MDPQLAYVSSVAWLVMVAWYLDPSFPMLDRCPTDINFILLGRSCPLQTWGFSKAETLHSLLTGICPAQHRCVKHEVLCRRYCQPC